MIKKILNLWHWIRYSKSRMESLYYTETEVENARRQAIAELRKRQIQETKNARKTH